MSPRFTKPQRIVGRSLSFRNASTQDAEFILKLRTDPDKSKHLSHVSAELSAQVAWLERYSKDSGQVYFIIEAQGHPIGTVRLYDQQGDSFCWGSWILVGGGVGASYESALMVYRFALSLGFTRSHFDVRKGNESVWSFHERLGAKRVGETKLDYLYEIEKPAIESALERYKRYLPSLLL